MKFLNIFLTILFFILLFILILISRQTYIDYLKPTPSLIPTNTPTNIPTIASSYNQLEEIKKIKEDVSKLPKCLQDELKKPGRDGWMVVCQDRLKKLFNVLDAQGSLYGRFDAKICEYYELSENK